MSITLPHLRTRVRFKLRDLDSRKGPLGAVIIDQAIRDAYFALASQLPPARVEVTNAFSIAAGADTFSLPVAGSAEYAGEVKIRLRRTGDFLEEISIEQMDQWRAGDTGQFRGVPERFTMWVDDQEVVRGRCHPRADVEEACDLFRSLVAADFDTATDMDATTIQFSRYGVQALVYRAAAELAGESPQAERWIRTSELMAYREACRKHDLQSTGATERYLR